MRIFYSAFILFLLATTQASGNVEIPYPATKPNYTRAKPEPRVIPKVSAPLEKPGSAAPVSEIKTPERATQKTSDKIIRGVDFRASVVSPQDKKVLRDALKQARRGNWRNANRTARKARDRIVPRIVKWVELVEARSPNADEIKSFIRKYPNWPMQDTLKKRVGIIKSKDPRKAKWRRLAEKTRDFMERKKYRSAYNNIKGKYRYFSGAERADALWLSGWLKLRFLGNPEAAVKYFSMLHGFVKKPISLARAKYWIARSYEDMNDKVKADFWYRDAAKLITTFYGQVAAQKLNYNHIINLPKYRPPSSYDARNFLRDDRIKAARLLDEIGEHKRSRLFLIRYMGEDKRTVQDYALAYILAQQTINYEWAVLAGKKALELGVLIPQANYPVLRFTPPAPEKAMVMAVTRQESQLNRMAKSSAGAVGMMQLMPATAKATARKMKIRYNYNRLYDKDYNMALGSFYLNEKIDNYVGSYILAAAAYNGGSGNVNSWIKRFGDPRKLDNLYDVIDWTEQIPFSETRNYVQRILENAQIYRARLNGGKHKLQIIQDLQR